MKLSSVRAAAIAFLSSKGHDIEWSQVKTEGNRAVQSGKCKNCHRLYHIDNSSEMMSIDIRIPSRCRQPTGDRF